MSYGPYTHIFAQRFLDAPKLDLGDRMGSTGYIDFLDHEDMEGSPVKQYVDKFGRPGFAVHLEFKEDFDKMIDGHRVQWKQGDRYVLCPFQRFTNRAKWSFGWGHSNINMEYRLYDVTRTHYFEGGSVDHAFLQRVVDGVDPHVRLVPSPSG